MTIPSGPSSRAVGSGSRGSCRAGRRDARGRACCGCAGAGRAAVRRDLRRPPGLTVPRGRGAGRPGRGQAAPRVRHRPALRPAALAGLGLPPGRSCAGARGAPQWPLGVVGSITHCDGYRAAAVARGRDLRTIGLDAEPDEPLPRACWSRSLPEERAAAAACAAGHVLGPAAVQRQGIRVQGVVPADPALARLRGRGHRLTADGTFEARLLVARPVLRWAAPLAGSPAAGDPAMACCSPL